MRVSCFIASWSVAIALFLSLARISTSLTVVDGAIENPAFEISKAEDMNLQDTTIGNLLESEPESEYKGPLLKAFLAAYESFKNEPAIPLSKKAIENYNVEFHQNSKIYVVVFTVGDKEKGAVTPGGQTALTVSVYYVIDKKDYKVISRKFLR